MALQVTTVRLNLDKVLAFVSWSEKNTELVNLNCHGTVPDEGFKTDQQRVKQQNTIGLLDTQVPFLSLSSPVCIWVFSTLSCIIEVM